MPHNPVQIILNDTDFHQAPDPGQPPRAKDFFEGQDRAFADHKAALLAAIDRIISEVTASPYGPATYLKVQMRTEALAKSYRPVGWLFKRDQFPCVGADAVGTLYFRAPLIYLAGLRSRIEEAEHQVEIKHRQLDGQPYRAPTSARAEVGAIATIEIAPPDQKRRFDLGAALSSFADPRTVSSYQVELFETPDPMVIAQDPVGARTLTRSLEKLFLSLGAGARSYMGAPIGRTPIIEVLLTVGTQPAILDNRAGLAGGETTDKLPLPAPVDTNRERHETVLAKLQDHPLVRAILPPFRLQAPDGPLPNDIAGAAGAEPVTIAGPIAGSTYPVVGIIDTGVSDVLKDWIVGRFDYLKPNEHDPGHGTAVAGLVVAGQQLNAPAVAPESHGCMIYDIPLFPKGNFLTRYRRGFTDFMEEVEQAVAEANAAHRVRVFNLSINAESDVEQTRYSIYASRLDQMADDYGVIFVNSAGNLPIAEARTPWPSRASDAIKYFAARQASDTIQKPSESVRSVSVGAINPPGCGQVEGAPTTYTRRGPGLQVGVKPDVAAYGGAGGVAPGATTGLATLASNGKKRFVAGTSFGAPLVARALAGLDSATEGGLHPETLRALLKHHARVPDSLTKRGLKELARSFVGFGAIDSVQDMLQTDDHQITLLFQSRLSIGEKKPVILRFPFTWPESLVNEGKCSGRARITLVYAPPLDPAFGAEFVRINLEASLKQLQDEPDGKGRPRYLNQIEPRYLQGAKNLAIPERALIDHGLKWWPTKQYESLFTDRGTHAQWRLDVTSSVRAETFFPAEGVPFAVLLTLEDAEGKKPIFQQMRQQLQGSRAQAVDVRTAVRVRARR